MDANEHCGTKCRNVSEKGTEEVYWECDLFECSSCGWEGIVDNGLVGCGRMIAGFRDYEEYGE